MAGKRNTIPGVGNVEAAREYNRKLREHIKGSDVEEEARRALPRDQVEAREMKLAERVGRHRAREEDPQLRPEKKQGR